MQDVIKKPLVMERDKRKFLVICRITITTSLVIIVANGRNQVNATRKQMVEEAGCPFVSTEQLLVRNVCLLPGYQANEMPNYDNQKTNIEIFLHKAFLLEIEEKRGRITIKIVQFMSWFDPRIKTNHSEIVDESGIIWLTQKNVAKIWHPDLDMYTTKLEEWKSIYHPSLYRKLIVLPYLHVDSMSDHTKEDDIELEAAHVQNNNAVAHNVTKIGALKVWEATILCMFDFSSYPFDTQHCSFVQFGIKGMNMTLISERDSMEWKQEVSGFYATIQNIGKFDNESVGFNITLQRIVRPYIYQYYVPCIAIVVVSQISFLIPLTALPGRVALIATHFLTLTNIFIHHIVSGNHF